LIHPFIYYEAELFLEHGHGFGVSDLKYIEPPTSKINKANKK
jgi:hypothetical protein